MGRLKKFREESEVSSFRIPKIEDLEEKQIFRSFITDFIKDLGWIRYSKSLENKETRWVTTEQNEKISKQNIRTAFKNMGTLLDSIKKTYDIKEEDLQ